METQGGGFASAFLIGIFQDLEEKKEKNLIQILRRIEYLIFLLHVLETVTCSENRSRNLQ